MDFGRDITQIALFLGSVAVITLLVSRSQDTVNIVKAVGGTYNGLLQTLTLQNSYGNAFQ